MKKDRAWLKEALLGLRSAGRPENNWTDEGRDLRRAQQWAWNNCIDRAYELAEELDEPQTNSQIDKLANFIMSEVEGEPSQSEGAVDTAIRIIKSYQNQETLSQDWIDEHAEYYEYLGYEVVPVNDLQKLLMPKQEEVDRYAQGWVEGIAEYVKDLESGENLIVVDKPTVSQFVAEWYESEGKRDRWWNWFYKWGKHESRTELEAKAIKWMQDFNEEAFVNMFLYGYTVEEEQKYYVDLDTAAYVARWVGDGSVQIYPDSIAWDNEYEFHLTEQEIKDYDPRFWLFAVEVEELE